MSVHAQVYASFSGRLPHTHIHTPCGLARKMRHQTQAPLQMSSPTASTTRSSSTRLSQRTRKKPAITSTPHRLYITLFPSSPKPKYFCVRGVTIVWRRENTDINHSEHPSNHIATSLNSSEQLIANLT